MRSITLLLSLFLTVFGGITAGAQITSLDDLSNDKTYTVVAARGYWGVKNGSFLYGYSGTPSTANADNTFAILKSDAGNYYLFNVGKQKFVSSTSSAAGTGKNALQLKDVVEAKFTVNSTGNTDYPWCFRAPESNNWLINMGGGLEVVVDSWSTLDAGNQYKITEVGDLAEAVKTAALQKIDAFENKTSVTVTYVYKLGDVTYTTQEVAANSSDMVTPPTIDYLTNTSWEGQGEMVGSSDRTIAVTCAENLPFTASTSYADAKWYMVDMHSSNQALGEGNDYIWTYKADADAVKAPSQLIKNPAELNEGQLWCFVGNLIDGFIIYNKVAGENMTLNVASNTEKGAMGVAASATKYKLVKSKSDNTGIAGATCFLPVGQSNYLNRQGDGENSELSRWSDNDAGSSCRFFAPDYFTLQYAETSPINAPKGALGSSAFFSESDKASAFIEAYNATTAPGYDHFDLEKANALSKLTAVCATYDVVAGEMVDGTYYRIINALPGFNQQKGLVRNSDTGTVQWNTVTKDNVDAIFQAKTNDTGTYLVTANYNTAIQGVGGLLNANLSASSYITLTALGAGQYNVVFGNGTMHANGHRNGAGASGTIINWSGSVNSASAWYIVPATDIEVALASVGDAAYATAYLPFAVNEVSGATAYTGAYNAANSTLDMTETTAIPANTGVVLKGTADATTAVLTIGEAAEATSGLTGTLAPITLADDTRANYLVLGTNEGAIGFYKPSATVASIPANKAYLANTTQATQAVALNFGGTPTGITGIEAADSDSNAPLYDITGRRVNGTAKGGIYIQNGRKFIVK